VSAIVVGQRQMRHPGGVGLADQFGGGISTVGSGGMGVEVVGIHEV